MCSVKIIEVETTVGRTLQYLCKGSSKLEQPVVIYSERVLNVEQLHKAYWNENEELKKKPKKTLTPPPCQISSGSCIGVHIRT